MGFFDALFHLSGFAAPALALAAVALCAWSLTAHAHGTHSERHREIAARIAGICVAPQYIAEELLRIAFSHQQPAQK